MILVRSFLRSKFPIVTFANSYIGSSKFDNRFGNGYLSESQWFEKRLTTLKENVNTTGFKILDQPVKIKCDNIEIKTWNKFSEIDVFDKRLLEVLLKMGHDEMTPIQKHTFDILSRQLTDLLGSAETGSGKTIAFLSPILNNLLKVYPREMMAKLKETNGETQFPLMLVLAPTRELVQQITSETQKLLKLTNGRVVDVIGGVSPGPQINYLQRGCHFVIATPGRLIDLVSRGILSLKYCNNLILDEADRMLDMGFERQIRQIVEKLDLPDETHRVTSMFSATFPESVVELATTLMKPNFGRVMIGKDAGSSETVIPESIEQKFTLVEPGAMYRECIKFLTTADNDRKTIVFCNRRVDVESLGRFLANQRVAAVSIHGGMSQRERQHQFQDFKNNGVKILIATSIAARGIDVADVECVVNVGMPSNIDDYMHRVGRCGRMGRPGHSMTFTSHGDVNGAVVKDLVKMLRRTGKEVPDFVHEVATRSVGGPMKYMPRQTRPSFGGYRGSSQDDDGDQTHNRPPYRPSQYGTRRPFEGQSRYQRKESSFRSGNSQDDRDVSSIAYGDRYMR